MWIKHTTSELLNKHTRSSVISSRGTRPQVWHNTTPERLPGIPYGHTNTHVAEKERTDGPDGNISLEYTYLYGCYETILYIQKYLAARNWRAIIASSYKHMTMFRCNVISDTRTLYTCSRKQQPHGDECVVVTHSSLYFVFQCTLHWSGEVVSSSASCR